MLKAQYIIGYFAEADNLLFSSRIGQEVKMQRYLFAVLFVCCAWLTGACSPAPAAPCLMVTLTGTQSGPPIFNGLAGAGTLLRYGDDSNQCGALKLQFDAGRGTILRLSHMRPTTA